MQGLEAHRHGIPHAQVLCTPDDRSPGTGSGHEMLSAELSSQGRSQKELTRAQDIFYHISLVSPSYGHYPIPNNYLLSLKYSTVVWDRSGVWLAYCGD